MSTAVGIHFGESSSSIAYINSHGQPMTIPDKHGSPVAPTLAIVDDAGHIFAGTAAADYSQSHSHRVLTDFRSFLGSSDKYWTTWQKQNEGTFITPMDATQALFTELLSSARNQIGSVEEAAITVPQHFSVSQRQAVIEAGLRSGLRRVLIVPTHLALFLAYLPYLQRTERLRLFDSAGEQRALIVQMEKTAFSLSIVRYEEEDVDVIASAHDSALGWSAWNEILLNSVATQFASEFRCDLRQCAVSLKSLKGEVFTAIRRLSAYSTAVLTCRYGEHHKEYRITQQQLERITEPLIVRIRQMVQELLKENRVSSLHIHTILTCDKFSRLPMIRKLLKDELECTDNTSFAASLGPDERISHGAARHAGMQSVVAESLPPMSSSRAVAAGTHSSQVEEQIDHNSEVACVDDNHLSFVDEVDLGVSQMDAARIVPSLSRLMRMRGAAAICQPAMLKGWLMDHVPDRRRDILLLTQSLEADVPARLVEQYREGAGTFQREVLSSRMVSEFGIQPALADEVVEIWSRVIRDLINANSLESLSLSTESKSRSLWSVMNRPSQAGSAEVW